MANPSLSACLAEIKGNFGKFYVYILSRPDGPPFYVGVGDARSSGRQRIEFHELDAQKPVPESKNQRKNRTIIKILESGGQIKYSIEGWYFWPFEANEREIELINKIGRLDLNKGTLTNLTNGGEGTRNPSVEIRKRASDRFKRLHATEEFIEKRNANIARVNSDPVLRAKTNAATREANKHPRNLKRLMRQIERLNSPDGIAASTERIRALNADPEFHSKHREVRAKTAKRLWSDPDFAAKHKAGCEKMRGDPEHQRKCKEGQKRRFADTDKAPIIRKQKSLHMASRWQDPIYRERMLVQIRERWADPAFRAKMSATRMKPAK